MKELVARRPAGHPLRIVGSTLLLVLSGCASVPRTDVADVAPSAVARGYRALFRAESERPAGKNRFRLAVALRPPDRMRLEFFGPVGGPRLVLAATPESSVALLPGERVYDRPGSPQDAIEKFLGVPLDAAALIAFLTGQPMCSPERVKVDIMTRPAATFGRTLSWFQVSCPPTDIRYEARCEERGGTLLSATLREAIGGAIILEAEYGDYNRDRGPRWPRQVRLRLPAKGTTIQLSAVEGPWLSDVPETLFEPEIPEGFESRDLSLFPAGPNLPRAETGPLH